MDKTLKKITVKGLMENKVALTQKEAHDLMMLDNKGFNELNEEKTPGVFDAEKFKLKNNLLRSDFDEKNVKTEVIDFARTYETTPIEQMDRELKKQSKKIKGL